jgi:Xylose isomerase-like TIM barrel
MPTYASGPNDGDGDDPLSRTVGIDHLTLLQVSPPELVTIASETGFAALGLRVATAGPGEEPWPLTVGSPMLEETLRRLQDTGVQVLDVEVIRLGPEIKRQDYEAVLEVGGRLGARFLNIMGDDEDLERIAAHFAQLTADARPYGLRPLIEPMAYRPVRSLELAVRIAERSGGGGVLFDSIHFQRCGGDLTYLRSVDPALLPILQLCDAPLVQPTGLPRPRWLPRGQGTDIPDAQLESRAMRLLPGDGELPLAERLAAMPAGIPINVEAPVLSLWETLPPADIARRARQSVSCVLSMLSSSHSSPRDEPTTPKEVSP